MIPRVKVLIADDSALMRKALREMLSSDNRFEVVGAARDGIDLLQKAEELRPDVITLDINMPRMDGLAALEQLVGKGTAPVVMVSSLTQHGADITLRALEMGAFDYVAKPGGTVSVNMASVREELIHKVRAAARSDVMRKIKAKTGAKKNRDVSATTTIPVDKEKAYSERIAASARKEGAHHAVAIGISTGGPKTIFDVLPALPANLNAAVFLVQHLPPRFTATFAERLNTACRMRCIEAQSGMEVKPGTIYLGKGGFHLNLLRRQSGQVFIRTPSRPQHVFTPSVDVMMQSVLDVYGPLTIGVLMTGMGDDGAEGMCAINRAGGMTIAESEESAVVWGMPGAAVAKGCVQIEAISWEIADRIIRMVGQM